jgi:mRNA interferase RelE/StbE
LDYRIDYKTPVAKDLKRIGRANAKRIMDEIDIDLVHNPDRFPSLSGPSAGMHKYRVGDYRVVFVIMDDRVLILRIEDRKDV